jgi:hypothetical protein
MVEGLIINLSTLDCGYTGIINICGVKVVLNLEVQTSFIY